MFRFVIFRFPNKKVAKGKARAAAAIKAKPLFLCNCVWRTHQTAFAILFTTLKTDDWSQYQRATYITLVAAILF